MSEIEQSMNDVPTASKRLDDWLTRAEAAELARVHVRTVDRWADDGLITRYRVTGIQSVRFKRTEIDALFVPDADGGEVLNRTAAALDGGTEGTDEAALVVDPFAD